MTRSPFPSLRSSLIGADSKRRTSVGKWPGLKENGRAHTYNTERHRNGGRPTEPIEAALYGEISHHLFAANKYHQHHHDGRSQYAIDDRAPVERLDRIKLGKIEGHTQD